MTVSQAIWFLPLISLAKTIYLAAITEENISGSVVLHLTFIFGWKVYEKSY